MKKLTVAEVRELVAEGLTIIANGVGLPPADRAMLNDIVAVLTKTEADGAETKSE